MHRSCRPAFHAALLLGLAAGPGCGRSPEPDASDQTRPIALPVEVLADTGHATTLAVKPPAEARAWLARVSPSRAPAPSPPLPAAEPESLRFPLEPPAPPVAVVDEGLKPPLPRNAPPLRLPPGARGRAASVELEVRVDEWGEVSDAEWAGGSRDSLLTRAAVECALAMRFHPALKGGRPVAVWCRQRFDFSRAAPAPQASDDRPSR
jgi:TonB family protein